MFLHHGPRISYFVDGTDHKILPLSLEYDTQRNESKFAEEGMHAPLSLGFGVQHWA